LRCHRSQSPRSGYLGRAGLDEIAAEIKTVLDLPAAPDIFSVVSTSALPRRRRLRRLVSRGRRLREAKNLRVHTGVHTAALSGFTEKFGLTITY
jgi:hypothetical protein